MNTNAAAVTETEPVVQVRDVWKIFGERANEALEVIRRDNLSKAEVLERYEAVVGVREVSFDVHQSEIFCIMGLSGSGKSTLVRHINRLIEPTHGEILISGVNVSKLNAKEFVCCALIASAWCFRTWLCCRIARCETTSPSHWSCATSMRLPACRSRTK
jgi:ABC-type glutathione transport system ATPase component